VEKMGKKFTIECESSEASATIILEENFPFPKWHCVEGKSVWGTPFKGLCLSSNLTGEDIELSTGVIIGDWVAVKNSEGKGTRFENNFGSFPAGEFEWICTKIED